MIGFLFKDSHAYYVFMKYFKNTSWVFFESVVRLILGLFVGVWVARYLGAEDFGVYSYAIGFVSIFGCFSTLGLDNIVVRELVSKKFGEGEILATTFFLRLLGGVLAQFFVFLGLLFFDFSNDMECLIFIMSFSFLFHIIGFLKLYFQSVVKMKCYALASFLSVSLSAVLKVFLIFHSANLASFAIVFALEAFFLSAFLLFFFVVESGFNNFFFSINKSLVRKLLYDSWPLIIASFASIFKIKIGLIMLGGMASFDEVGYYSSSLRVSELWFMIPVLLGSSIYPALINARKNGVEVLRSKVIKITMFMFFIAVPFAFLISYFSDFIMVIVFGDEYSEAGGYLSLQIWAGLPYVVFFAYSQVTYIEGKTKIHLYLSVLSIILIAIFNYWFIPFYGGVGAVYSSLITAFLVSVFMIALVEKDIKIFTKGKSYV